MAGVGGTAHQGWRRILQKQADRRAGAGALEGQPAEVAQGDGIGEAQQGFAAAEQLRQGPPAACACRPCSRCAKPRASRASPGGAGRAAASHRPRRPPAGSRCRGRAVRSQWPGSHQGVVAGLLLAVGHQGAVAALGGVVAPGLVGVIHHQQLAAGQALAAPAATRAPGRDAARWCQPGGRWGPGLEQPEGSRGANAGGGKGSPACSRSRGWAPGSPCTGHPLVAPEGPVPHDALHRQGIEHLVGQHHAGHRVGRQRCRNCSSGRAGGRAARSCRWRTAMPGWAPPAPARCGRPGPASPGPGPRPAEAPGAPPPGRFPPGPGGSRAGWASSHWASCGASRAAKSGPGRGGGEVAAGPTCRRPLP
jgi:hypothetical protein